MWFFPTPPPLGYELKWRKKTYRCVAMRDHVNKAGEDSAVLTWAAVCPICKNDYQWTSGLKAVVPRSICKTCIALPRDRRPHVAARLARPVSKPDVETMVWAVAETPHGMAMSLNRRAWNWAPRLLKRHSARLSKFDIYEIDAGLTDAIAAGRVLHVPVGWNRSRRLVYGLQVFSKEEAQAGAKAVRVEADERVKVARTAAGCDLFD